MYLARTKQQYAADFVPFFPIFMRITTAQNMQIEVLFKKGKRREEEKNSFGILCVDSLLFGNIFFSTFWSQAHLNSDCTLFGEI